MNQFSRKRKSETRINDDSTIKEDFPYQFKELVFDSSYGIQIVPNVWTFNLNDQIDIDFYAVTSIRCAFTNLTFVAGHPHYDEVIADPLAMPPILHEDEIPLVDAVVPYRNLLLRSSVLSSGSALIACSYGASTVPADNVMKPSNIIEVLDAAGTPGGGDVSSVLCYDRFIVLDPKSMHAFNGSSVSSIDLYFTVPGSENPISLGGAGGERWAPFNPNQFTVKIAVLSKNPYD